MRNFFSSTEESAMKGAEMENELQGIDHGRAAVADVDGAVLATSTSTNYPLSEFPISLVVGVESEIHSYPRAPWTVPVEQG